MARRFIGILPALLPSLLAAQTWDLVIGNGRVIDPESGLDAVRNVGIAGGKIGAVSAGPLSGREEIDARGLVVAPGFIDLHNHGQTPENYRAQAMDGVTTTLELEIGVSPVSEWYAERAGKAVINYGASAGHVPARMRVMKDTGRFLPRDAAMNRRATPEERRAIAAELQKGLDEGALGLGFGLGYTPAATSHEIVELFELASRWKRPAFVHLRHLGGGSPGVVESLVEVIGAAAATGAPLHVVHLNSMALRQTPEALRLIEGARARGLDVTTEAYPYIAGATLLESALFEPGWQENIGITYSDIVWVATGERLTRETFERYRKRGGEIVMFMNTEEMVRAAISNPAVMIASDGELRGGKGHPRSSGTYARLLGRYVREQKALTLMDAVRKSTLMPAVRLEAMSAQMRNKGRIRVGADADISVFDPDRVIDKATFEQPALFSEGFRYVLVGGTVVVRDGRLQEGTTPGRPVVAR